MTVPPAIPALTAHAAALQRRLETWCAINSGSDHHAGLARMADALEPALRELTADVLRIPVAPDGRVALVARHRPQAPFRILCSGHYDTVYGASSEFQHCQQLDDQTLQGPGVADMKGGIVVMLAALAAFEATPAAGAMGWEVVLTPDEEIGSASSRPLLEQTARTCHLGLIFEPARETGDMVASRKGTGIFTVTCHGRAAHAGRDPAAGRNAIMALAEYLLALQERVRQWPDLLLNVGRIQGGGTVNVVPDFAVAELNARSGTAASAEALVAEMRRLAAGINEREGYRVELKGQFNRPSMESSAVAESLRPAWLNAAQALHQAPFTWVDVGGGSDGNLLQAVGLPCLDGLGVIGGGLHSPREYIQLPSLVARAQLVALFLHQLAIGHVRLPGSV
jgi:glutamate carboxypeptidase